MINLDPRFFPLKNHTILDKLKKEFRLLSSDESLCKLFDNNIVYIYPKMLSFSFCGYPDSIQEFQFSAKTHLNEDVALLDNNDEKIVYEINSSRIIAFFEILTKVFSIVNFHPIFIIDLRKTKVIDELLMIKIVEILDQSKLTLIILSDWNSDHNTENKFEAICSSSKCIFLATTEKLFDYVKKFIRLDTNKYTIKMSGNITLSTIENHFSDPEFYQYLGSRYLIELDINDTKKISFFSLNLLSVLINTICHNYGVVWRIKNDNKKSHVFEYLVKLRSFEINKLFLSQTDYPKASDEYNQDYFGTVIFDTSQKVLLISKIHDYISRLNDMFPNYFDRYVSISYKSRKEGITKISYTFTYLALIEKIIFELVENVIKHSEGIGYLSIEIRDYQIKIFLGDSGIGLKKGILKNYKLEDVITDDKLAVAYAFSLSNYKEHRKPDLFDPEHVGLGLRDTLSNIYSCRGKFLIRTNSTIGAFINPMKERHTTEIFNSQFQIQGTQYMIIIPIFDIHDNKLPNTPVSFLNMEN